MRYYWLTALLFLSAMRGLLANFTMPHGPWKDMRIRHTWNAVPANWKSLGRPPAGTTTNLYIALKPDQESAIVDAFYEVSNPRHPRYGKHLSREQIAELVKPHPETLELVRAWLVHHGVPPSSISPTHGGGWLTVTDVLVSQANQLLGASYQIYQHDKTNEIIVRTVSYSLPEVLHTHIQAVAPTTYFSSTREMRQTPHRRSFEGAAGKADAASGKFVTVPSSRDDNFYVTPEYLRWLYNTFAYVPTAMDRNALGVIGEMEQYPSHDDLITFMEALYSDTEDVTYTPMVFNDGEYDESNPGTEANVDLQYAEAITYPTPIFFYSLGGRLKWNTINGFPKPGDLYLEWFSYMLKEPTIPQTISISYSSYEKHLPQEYAMVVCHLFLLLGSRGVSVLCSSGNEGVGPENCDDGSGNVRFVPTFPASCPYVTSVGGTIGHDPEIAANFSGGGFSFYFPRPEYQDWAVAGFLQYIRGEYAGLYNRGGRGYPDVSAQAYKFLYVIDGIEFDTSGTSCATPTVAGIISLLNDYQISKGRSPLGFLNLLLYGDGLEGFNDIIIDSNPGCKTRGFPAIHGWDPVTGIGTPDFEALQDILDAAAIAGVGGTQQGN